MPLSACLKFGACMVPATMICFLASHATKQAFEDGFFCLKLDELLATPASYACIAIWPMCDYHRIACLLLWWLDGPTIPVQQRLLFAHDVTFLTICHTPLICSQWSRSTGVPSRDLCDGNTKRVKDTPLWCTLLRIEPHATHFTGRSSSSCGTPSLRL